MYKMTLRPDADGYSSADPNDWISTALEGGVGRYRRDKVGSSMSVTVKWTLNPTQYQYILAFYALVGSGKFLIDLLSEQGGAPTEHEVNIVPGSFQLGGQQGLTYIQQAQLEVKPIVRDAVMDMEVVVLFEASQGNFDLWYNMFEHLANVTIPNAEAFNA